MRFSRRGTEYVVSRITGVSDCYLAVELGTPAGDIVLEAIAAGSQREEPIKQGILEGIADFNRSAPAPVAVRRVRFDAARDAGDPMTYRWLVQVLLKRATGDEPFEGSS